MDVQDIALVSLGVASVTENRCGQILGARLGASV